MVFVAYDISDTPTRTHFIRRLQYYGLYRIQKSIFSGFLNPDERLDLADEFDKYLSGENDSIVLIPACESCSDSIFYEGNLNLPKLSDFEFV